MEQLDGTQLFKVKRVASLVQELSCAFVCGVTKRGRRGTTMLYESTVLCFRTWAALSCGVMKRGPRGTTMLYESTVLCFRNWAAISRGVTK